MTNVIPIKRPGHYVEGRWFGDKFNQACARARHLSQTFGRPVAVSYLAPEDKGQAAVPYVVTVFDETMRKAQ